MSPKESVEGANTVLRGSVRTPEGFSEESYSLLPQGFSTLAQTTKIMRFTGKWSQSSPRPWAQYSVRAHTSPRGTMRGSHVPLVQCERLACSLSTVWEAHTGLSGSVRGSHCTKGQCESFHSNSVDYLLTFCSYIWPVKSQSVTN